MTDKTLEMFRHQQEMIEAVNGKVDAVSRLVIKLTEAFDKNLALQIDNLKSQMVALPDDWLKSHLKPMENDNAK